MTRENLDSESGPKTAAALIDRVLEDDNAYVREIAADFLASIPAYGKELAPKVATILRNPSESADRRARAAQVLGAIGNGSR